MAFNYSPKIVTDGLVLCLDAANSKSFPKDSSMLNGLLSYYPFEGNNNDIVGGYNGNVAGTYSTGKVDSCVNFTTTAMYNIGDTSTYAFVHKTGVFSFNLWYKSVENGLEKGLITNTGTYENGFFIDKVGSILYFFIAKAGILIISKTINSYFDDTDVWHMLTITGDGVGCRFYKDGVLLSYDLYVNSFGTEDSTNLLSIGCFGVNNSVFTGGLDEVGIWNKTLSQNEINLLYNSNTGVAHPFQKLIKDLSKDSNDGVLMNAPTYDSGSIIFDGTNDYIDLGYEINSYIAIGSPFSFEAFCYLTPNGTDQAIIGNTWAVPGILLRMTSGNAIRFIGVTNGGSYAGLDSSVITNGWYHVVGTYNGTPSSFTTSDIKLYVNSILYTNAVVGGPVSTISSANNLNIGRSSDFNDYAYLNGKVAIAKVYNKALSQAEVTQNFNALKKRFGL